MDIDQHAYAEGPDIYYDADFRAAIEAHIDYLRTHEETKILYLEPHIVYRYEFDMYGLLLHYNIPPYLHWIILRMNNLYSMTNFPKDLSQLYYPSEGCVNIVRQIYQTAHPTA